MRTSIFKDDEAGEKEETDCLNIVPISWSVTWSDPSPTKRRTLLSFGAG